MPTPEPAEQADAVRESLTPLRASLKTLLTSVGRAIGLAWSLVAVGCAAMSGVDEPRFAVELQDESFSVRRYEPRVVAETVVEGAWSDAGNEGFRRLAGYIFGNNRASSKIAMTAPVAQRASSVELPMTAPVGQRRSGDSWVVAFTMPAGETLAKLPEPEDPRVILRELPALRVAVVEFSGGWSESRFAERTRALRAWADGRGLRLYGDPETNRYDPPWTLWFLRRNEVWWAIDDGGPSPAG